MPFHRAASGTILNHAAVHQVESQALSRMVVISWNVAQTCSVDSSGYSTVWDFVGSNDKA